MHDRRGCADKRQECRSPSENAGVIEDQVNSLNNASHAEHEYNDAGYFLG